MLRSSASKPTAALALLALVLMAPGCTQPIAKANPAEAEKELLALHEAWAEARIKGDVAFLETFYGQELRLNVMDGGVVERKDDIAMFDRAGKSDLEVIKPDYIKDVDMTVMTYGDTAVVTGVENLKGTAMGNYGEMALRFTNVLVHRDGRWQLVHHQSTPVQTRQTGSPT
jgi:ketosteroid isomerase-like protein